MLTDRDGIIEYVNTAFTKITGYSAAEAIGKTPRILNSGIPENISFTLDVPETECTVKGDAALLQQALLNLVTNARHAVAAQSRPAIHVSLDVMKADEALWERHPDLPRQPCARLTVEDNGCGIPEKYLNKLFDPFFTTKEVGEGTGLGLAILDVVMPQLGGVDAALHIRASAPGLPVVFQTGYGEEQVRAEMKD